MTSSSQLWLAPGKWIQWFYQQLDRADKDMQVFIDLDTEIEIGVFQNTHAIQDQFLQPTLWTALHCFLWGKLYQMINAEVLKRHLTAVILMESWRVPGLLLADIMLSAPVLAQGMLLQYWWGLFMHNSICMQPRYPLSPWPWDLQGTK